MGQPCEFQVKGVEGWLRGFNAHECNGRRVGILWSCHALVDEPVEEAAEAGPVVVRRAPGLLRQPGRELRAVDLPYTRAPERLNHCRLVFVYRTD